MPAPRVSPIVAVVLLSGGCASAGLPLPEPGHSRAAVERRVTTCSGERCTFDLRVGGTRYRVRSEARTVTPEEAAGGRRPSLARRVAGGIGGALLRGIGLTTSSQVVVLDTRTVDDAASALRLRCALVAIVEVETERVGDEDEQTRRALAEGADCVVTPAADTVPRWRYRAGIAPVTDSIALAVAALEPAANAPTPGREPSLERHMPASGEILRYTVADTLPNRWIPQQRTVVRRADGSVVGVIVRLAGDPVAVDVAPGADPEEAGLLRMLGVVFVRR